MGRAKLAIKKLDHSANRLATYSKRKNGLIKKAQELSILCDIDLVLIMFSPTGKPVTCQGNNSNIEAILERFSSLSPQERSKRKLESLLALKRRFTKSGHDVNVQDLTSNCSNQTTNRGMATYANLLRTQLSDVNKRLDEWSNPEKIDNLEFLELMEQYINNSLLQVQIQKDHLREQNSSSQSHSHLECCSYEQLFKVPNMNQPSMGSFATSSSEDSNSHPKSEVWPNPNDPYANLDYGVFKESIKTESMRNESISYPHFTTTTTMDNTEMIFPTESVMQNPYKEDDLNLTNSLEIPLRDQQPITSIDEFVLQPHLGSCDHNWDSSTTTGYSSNYHPTTTTFNCYNQFYSLDEYYSWPNLDGNDYGTQTGGKS
ncbi:agamous-like MADS-box protein AGL30 isoform X2 [Impatiens glandulifera]|uniref:agamous-like MADS-box protein AGL30 isoform X2 n=1 Tax=Impatiens glandulifera TaxID=253017 RepID=UPI001FB08D29|nr:agamous-like MADS-box protein AGL30 isoform X2 [Impatiens glandulifera]